MARDERLRVDPWTGESGRSYFEHLRPADRALALGRRAAVFHGDLDGVFDLPFGFALYAVGFCCHQGLLVAAPHSLGLPRFPLAEAPRARE
jgi:hypothetical protein